jgi:A/G-specific adenine glycosylase
MAALPGDDWSKSSPPHANSLAIVRHVFTHFSLDLHVIPRSDPDGEGWWQPVARLSEAGLPTLYQKAAEAVLARHDRIAA